MENIKNSTPISVVKNEFVEVDPEKPWEQDVRFLKDVAAGCNPYEAIQKYKKRMRAVKARAKEAPSRAAERIKKEEAWQSEFNSSGVVGQKDEVRHNDPRLKVEDDVYFESESVSKPLTVAEKQRHRTDVVTPWKLDRISRETGTEWLRENADVASRSTTRVWKKKQKPHQHQHHQHQHQQQQQQQPASSSSHRGDVSHAVSATSRSPDVSDNSEPPLKRRMSASVASTGKAFVVFSLADCDRFGRYQLTRDVLVRSKKEVIDTTGEALGVHFKGTVVDIVSVVMLQGSWLVRGELRTGGWITSREADNEASWATPIKFQ